MIEPNVFELGARAPSRRLRLAIFGVVAESVGSSAGAYPPVMAALLERGHRVEFFGNPLYVRPRSLEGLAGYRFHPLHVEPAERLWNLAEPYEIPRAVVAQLCNAAYHREAIRQIERRHENAPFDVLLCTDQQPFWSSRLPLIAWPQGAPQTEAAALRIPELARAVVRAQGIRHYAAVQAFYAYRVAMARLALGCADLYLCGGAWSAGAWRRFGAAPDQVRPFPYPVELGALAGVPALRSDATVDFLWLGRAVPRKRLDLFLKGFALLRGRYPDVRARVVGNMDGAFATAVLESHGRISGLSIERPVSREDVPRLFSEVHVLVQPSQNENFGFSVAEALAAGRPVVGGPTNGTLEYAADAGFRFAEYTPGSVAQAMERAMFAVRASGPELSERARAAARVFTVDAVADALCRACEELLEHRRTRAAPT